MLLTSTLKEYLPHRDPMIWVDRVIHSHENGGVVEVDLKKDSFYMDGDVLRPLSLIEMSAQGFGFINASELYKKNLGAHEVKGAYLIQIEDFILKTTETIKSGVTIEIELNLERVIEPIYFIKAQCRMNNKSIAELSLRLLASEKII